METLATSNSIIGNNTASLYFSASSLKERLLCGGPEIISYRRPRKFASSGLQHLVSLRRGGIDLFSCLSSHHQADTQNDAVENQDTNQSKTVRVKFQLQKECTFGEHFFVVGDDPIFGSWDVTSAIPLNWADGHQWAAEMEIPVGKTIQFKFLLQGKTGNVVWQPGPDRTFQPWETTNTIIVSEDWDSAESRMLSEEEKIVNEYKDSPIVPEKLMIVESLTYPNEELIHDTNKEPSVAPGDTSIAEKSSVESHTELIDGSNISASEESGSNMSASEENASNISLSEENASNISASKQNVKAIVAENISYPKERAIVAENISYPKERAIVAENISYPKKRAIVAENISYPKERAIVAENISYPKESLILNTSNNINEVYNNSNGETTFTSNSDIKITEGILKNDEKDATVKVPRNTDVQESLINYEVPILVPGLPPTPTISDQATPQHGVKCNGINESNDHKLPENVQMNQKQDPRVVAEQEIEAKLSYEENDKEGELQSVIQGNDTNKIENDSDLQEINEDILQNDITWGHKTLMKFFTNLRLL